MLELAFGTWVKTRRNIDSVERIARMSTETQYDIVFQLKCYIRMPLIDLVMFSGQPELASSKCYWLLCVCVSVFSLDRLSAKNSINTVLILWVFVVPSECARTRVFPMKRLFRSFSNPLNGFYIKSACAERVKEQELQHTAKVTMWMQFLAIA